MCEARCQCQAGGRRGVLFSCNCDVPWILALINIRYPVKVLWNIVWRGSGDGGTLFYDDTFIRIKRIRYHDCTTYYITNPSIIINFDTFAFFLFIYRSEASKSNLNSILFLLLTLNVRQKCSEQKLTLPWCIDLERQRCKLWHGSQTPQNKSDIERIIRGFINAKVISKLKLCWILDMGHISCHCFTNYFINPRPHIAQWRLHISLTVSITTNLTFYSKTLHV